MKTYRYYVDGGLLGKKNPSPEGVYFSVRVESDGDEPLMLNERTKVLDKQTNNEAEWLAVNEALCHIANQPRGTAAILHSDSELLVSQLLGKKKVHEPKLKAMWEVAERLKRAAWLRGVDLTLMWVSRKVNVEKLGH